MVTVTVRYNRVAVLETYSQTANVTGTITRVVQDTNGITIDVALASGWHHDLHGARRGIRHPGRKRPSPSIR